MLKNYILKIKKIFMYQPGAVLTAVFAMTALVLLLVPLFRIVPYAVPWYDDYNYGGFVKRALAQDRSLWTALTSAKEWTGVQWYAWQGTFSSIYFMSLVPAVWGDEYYFWGPLFLILMLLFSVLVLVWVLARTILKADKASCVALQAIAAATVIVLIHTSQAGFFWYNGGVHYVGMHSFFMLTTAAWIKLLTTKSKAAGVLLFLWTLVGAVLAGGANYVTALQGLLVLLSLTALGGLMRKRQALLLLPSLIVYGVAFYKNVSAPGNNVRGNILNSGGPGRGPVISIARSFSEAVLYLPEFTGLITLAVMLLLVPIIWRMLKNTKVSFRYPGVLLAWSFCLYATGFTPSLYALGHAGLGRTLNAVKITFQILLILNEVYWLGWLKQKLGERKLLRFLEDGAPLVFYGLIGLAMLGIFTIESNQAGSYSSYGAYYYVHTGEAYEFHREYLARVEAIVNGDAVVEVEPYHFRPWLLCAGDLTKDPESEENRAMAEWYRKDAIICVGEETQQE